MQVGNHAQPNNEDSMLMLHGCCRYACCGKKAVGKALSMFVKVRIVHSVGDVHLLFAYWFDFNR